LVKPTVIRFALKWSSSNIRINKPVMPGLDPGIFFDVLRGGGMGLPGQAWSGPAMTGLRAFGC